MKFNIGLTQATKNFRMTTWNEWFAWYPVLIRDGDTRWLERVLRRRDVSNFQEWEYRAIENETKI